MRKNRAILNWLVLCFVFFQLLAACVGRENRDDIVITTKRLSDRVLVLSETVMNNNVVAVASERGIVVVDDSGLPSTASKMRKIIEQEFRRSDFLYVINTHSNWDHTFGNQVFPDAEIIGHINVTAGMIQDQSIMPRRITGLKQRIENEKSRLEGLEPGSEEARNAETSIQSMQRQLHDFSDVFISTPPTILFTDRMVLDLGDLTVRLYYFGRAHSQSDILIRIPEEKILMTGDVFLDQRWLPLFADEQVLDIDRWLDVLGRVLDDDNAPETVIPAHMELWGRQTLVLWRDYIQDLWKGVKESRARGLTLGEFKAEFPLPEPCFYLRERGHSDERILGFHDHNIEAFWNQLPNTADR